MTNKRSLTDAGYESGDVVPILNLWGPSAASNTTNTSWTTINSPSNANQMPVIPFDSFPETRIRLVGLMNNDTAGETTELRIGENFGSNTACQVSTTGTSNTRVDSGWESHSFTSTTNIVFEGRVSGGQATYLRQTGHIMIGVPVE